MLTKANLELAKMLSTADAGSKQTLGGIQVTPTETVATNGHWMAIVTTLPEPEGGFPAAQGFTAQQVFEPFILPRKAALDILKTLPTDTEASHLPILKQIAVAQSPTTDKPHAVLYTTDLDTNKVFQSRPVVGQFPNWRAVVPDPVKATSTIGMSVEYLAKIATELKAMGVKHVVLRTVDSESALRFDGMLESGQNVTVILMPYKLTDEILAMAPTYKVAEPTPVAEPGPTVSHEAPAAEQTEVAWCG